VRFQEPLEQAIAQTEALAHAYRDRPLVSVLPAPHSLHGASRELVCAGAKLAKRLGTPWHIHLSEQPGDADFAMERYGLRPLACLEDWGILDRDTCIVHGIWLDDEDLERMQAYGCRQVYNPLTNMALGDGVARLPELLQRGVPVALGTDANTDSSLFLEARMAEYLQRSQKLSMGHVSAEQLFAMTNRNGAHALGLSTGHLAVGQAGDFLALNLSSPSMLPAVFTQDGDDALRQALLNQVLFSAVPQEAIQSVYVAGQKRVEAGKHVSIDLAAIFQSVFA
jgi:5-methylthioadenosine/S-adenosylhomocysteine deaminase